MGFLTLFAGAAGKKNIIIAIIVALIVAAGGVWVYKQKSALLKANQTITEVTKKYDAAVIARDKAIEAARANENTIKMLQQEKIDADAAVKKLQDRNKADSATINKMADAISSQAKNPANQVALSPVLQQTVDLILAERAKREGATK